MNFSKSSKTKLTLHKKKEIITKIIDAKKNGKSIMRSLARSEKIHHSTISKMFKNRFKIFEWIEKHPNTTATVIDCDILNYTFNNSCRFYASFLIDLF
jgi:hypothetical protein